jgi:hypothetical protein
MCRGGLRREKEERKIMASMFSFKKESEAKENG